MCTGLEFIIPLIGAGLSAAGGYVTMNEQQKNAERQAEARNEELNRTLLKNDSLAEESRDTFNQRFNQSKNAETDKQQKAAEADRAKTAEAAIDNAPVAVEDVPLTGSAPNVIKSDLAKEMGAALQRSKASAKAQAKLGGYGDMWLDQGFQDQAAGRDLAMTTDFANGNMALLPYAQDFAETRATKPISPLGGLLQGFGGMIGGMGGGGGLTPKKKYTSPTGDWI